ncbi:arylsulfatase [Emticicia sp. BO119]|uniref:sulfatase family protein n=1 Tax=Emticicia sp. BO119 TaxID=2757768 RepID=UPI0015F0C66A|nr:arylsulfatase [Emticicia sp. BO119]MBA4849389.1 arylsulfatase [Emticicia sp. BO119]
MKFKLLILLSFLFLNGSFIKKEPLPQKPNIIIIYADDLGYGDVSAYEKGILQTPNMDKMAKNGIRFTNGHATSATCTPSRYGLLTGIYPWRKEGARVLPGDAPLLIDTSLVTIPKMLKKAGYQTGIVGKWHLGIGKGEIDWNKDLLLNPNDVGFDYSYIMAATTDRVPTVFIENRRVVGLEINDPLLVNYNKNFEGEPTALSNPELMTKQKWDHGHNMSMHNGIPRIGFQKGGKSALWHDEDMADIFLKQSLDFIHIHKNKPFFLYYGLHQPHVPRSPHPRFAGKSGLGVRGDVILEADWCVGEIMKKLEETGLDKNTLVILSSDNGPVLNDGYIDGAVEMNGQHTPSGGLRGGKYSLYEAGTRVPFIASWKGVIRPQVSDALVCQIDFLASFAQLTGQKNPSADSQNLLNVFLGKSKKGRKNLVLEASNRLAFKKGDWVLIPPHKGSSIAKEVNIELGNSLQYQLFNLKSDNAEQNNLAKVNPRKLEEMKEAMKQIVDNRYNFDAKELELK